MSHPVKQEEAAKFLGVTVKELQRLAREGRIKSKIIPGTKKRHRRLYFLEDLKDSLIDSAA